MNVKLYWIPPPPPKKKKDCHCNQATEKLLVKFKFQPSEIAEWKISHPPKKLYSSANSRVPPGLKSRLMVLWIIPLHVPSCLMEIFFPSKQAVLCSSQWLGNVIPLDPHTVFSCSGHDFLQIQAAFLPTIEHSWPVWHRILVHGSKIRI